MEVGRDVMGLRLGILIGSYFCLTGGYVLPFRAVDELS